MDKLNKYIIEDEFSKDIREFCKDRPKSELKGFNYRSVQSEQLRIDNPMHNPEVRKTWLKIIKSEEHSKKMSITLRKRDYKHSEETKRKIAKSNTGNKHSEETKNTLREIRLKQPCPRTGKFKDNVSDHALYMREYRRKLREKKNENI